MSAQIALRFRRLVKYWFIRFKLYRLVAPIEGVMWHTVMMAHFSRWCNQHRDIGMGKLSRPTPGTEKRVELFEHLVKTESLGTAIDYLEFGVAAGDSLRWWLANNAHPDSRFFGFDSFEGIPEDFGLLKKGTFSTNGTPQFDDERCHLVVGLFQNTLADFLADFTRSADSAGFESQRRMVLHMDADLYSSTLFVLSSLATCMKAGDIIIFDEFGVPTHEFRAFMDFAGSFGLRYEVLGQTGNYFQLALRVITCDARPR